MPKCVLSETDAQDVQKVVAGRLDLAVIDSNAFAFLKASHAQITKRANDVQMNAKLLVEKELFVAFRNSDEGKKWRDIFNAGLEKIDIEAVMKAHM